MDGLRVLHLQCHFGADTLVLAQRGATVVGLDFSRPAIEAARELADALGLADQASFYCADLYDAPDVVPGAASFDRVFVTWGAINWLPDIQGWARVVAHFLKPGGALYMAEGHPTAFVFDDEVAEPDGRPGWLVPYFSKAPYVDENPVDYTGDNPALTAPTHEWVHTISDILNALIDAGLDLKWLNEHAAVPWQMFSMLRRDLDRMYRWPDQEWFPLAFSLWAVRV